jgi:hypothetical protein
VFPGDALVNTTPEEPSTIRLPRAVDVVPTLALCIEVTERFLGHRRRRVLDSVVRHLAELYGEDGQAFRKRLDSALSNRRIATVDWWEAGRGS